MRNAADTAAAFIPAAAGRKRRISSASTLDSAPKPLRIRVSAFSSGLKRLFQDSTTG